MFWGYSPALDLLNEYEIVNSLEGKSEINILVAGSADARHVLMTLAKHYQHEPVNDIKMNFYIVDLLLEFVARELLLTLIALEPCSRIGLKEKANIWMEIFGNSLLRPTTAEYLTKKSYQYIKMVTNTHYQLKRMPCLDLSNLKYIEKDRLETIFKFWINNEFNMASNWDKRVRKHLGTRYDTKMGAFDWDYYMVLKGLKDGDKVNPREYKQWRNTGIAFSWLEKDCSVSNSTLAVGIDRDGDRLISFDYVGDIVSSPYYCFGLDCEDEGMLKIVNGMYTKRATDITERNLMRLFYEIENNSKYTPVGETEDFGVVVTKMAALNFNDPKLNVEHANIEDDYAALSIKHKLVFLPITTLDDSAKLFKFQNFFDLIIFSQSMQKKLTSQVLNMAKDKALIIMETRKFLLLKREAQKKFVEDIVTAMKDANCEQIGSINFEEDCFMKFQVNLNKDTRMKESEENKTKLAVVLVEREETASELDLGNNKDTGTKEGEENYTRITGNDVQQEKTTVELDIDINKDTRTKESFKNYTTITENDVQQEKTAVELDIDINKDTRMKEREESNSKLAENLVEQEETARASDINMKKDLRMKEIEENTQS